MSVLPDPENEPVVDSSDEEAETVEPTAEEAEPRREPVAEVDLGYVRWDCTSDDPELLARAEDDARAAIEAGECIVLPTDTVYGIGADAFNGEAVQGLLDAKVRGRDMPPPVLIGEPSLIRALATDIPDAARELVSKHWPGPLTVILKRQPSLKMDLGDAEGTVALRVPDHELAREILRATGPMAVSSANISGLPAALTCDEAIDQLGASVSVYLDGGRLGENGQPSSTIVDFTQADHGQVLRRGALSVDVLRETLPDIEDLVDDEDQVDGRRSGGRRHRRDGTWSTRRSSRNRAQRSTRSPPPTSARRSSTSEAEPSDDAEPEPETEHPERETEQPETEQPEPSADARLRAERRGLARADHRRAADHPSRS